MEQPVEHAHQPVKRSPVVRPATERAAFRLGSFLLSFICPLTEYPEDG